MRHDLVPGMHYRGLIELTSMACFLLRRPVMRSSNPGLGYFSTGLAALAISLASGCQIYLDVDDGDGNGGGAVDAGVPYPDAGGCYGGPVPVPPYNPALLLRDPSTGQCVDFNWDGGWDPCLPVPPVPVPPWGQCDSACSLYDVDELGCMNASGCQAAYTQVVQADGQVDTVFVGCWDNSDDYAADPSLACEQLDAWNCSMRDDCSPLHADGSCMPDAMGGTLCWYGNFATCMPEVVPGCTSDDHCAPGWECVVPDSCAGEPPCSGAPGEDCSTSCAGTCVPAAGSCNGEVLCDSVPPACPPDRVPGVANGCWTGECILLSDCEPPTLDCRAIPSQEECLAQDACMPVYGGLNCSCDDSGCTCEQWVYEGCTSR